MLYRNGSLLRKKREQWTRERAEQREEWFPFGKNNSRGGGNPVRTHEAPDSFYKSPMRTPKTAADEPEREIEVKLVDYPETEPISATISPSPVSDHQSSKKESPMKGAPKSERRAPPAETDEENEETKQGIYDRPLVVEGKRERTKVTPFASTLTPEVDSPKADTNAGRGAGMALGDVATANAYITKKRIQDLRKLHKLLYLRDGQAAHSKQFKKALRKFNGWWFPEKSDEWNKRVAYLRKLKVPEIKHLCAGVGLHQAAATKCVEIDNLMNYLRKPTQVEASMKKKIQQPKPKS